MKKAEKTTVCLFDVLTFVESNLDTLKNFVEAYRALEDALLLSGKLDSLCVRQNGKVQMLCPLFAQFAKPDQLNCLQI